MNQAPWSRRRPVDEGAGTLKKGKLANHNPVLFILSLTRLLLVMLP